MSGPLIAEQCEAFHSDGFVVMPAFYKPEQCEKSEKDEATLYGSALYGAFIYTCLKQPERITCFLDQNPHRQKQTLMGKRIIAPEALPESIRRLYVGLNPSVAHEVLDGLDWGRALEVFYP